jgi:FkbM family methyltransferase
VLSKIKNKLSRINNLRDILRNQEIIINSLILDVSEKSEELYLFNFIVRNRRISSSRNYSDLVALFYLGEGKRYLEIGAGDPISGSDTYFLAKEKNWTGVQIEPDLAIFKRLELIRGDSLKINAAVIGDKDTKKYFLNPNTMQLSEKKKSFTQIQTISLEFILKSYGAGFDALFIDIEGGELEVISSIFFLEFEFKFINIERIWNDNQINKILSNYGYRQIGAAFSSYSGWYIKESKQ